MQMMSNFLSLKYIYTIDFTFNDVKVLNANSFEELCQMITENKIIKILNDNEIEYLNPNYIMYFG